MMHLDRNAVKDAVFKGFTAVHTLFYRRTGGRIGGRVMRAPTLLLTTTGRTSGKPRSVPLLYLADGHRMVIVASFGGDDRNPQWFKNLEANPAASVTVGAQTRPVRAAVADPDEKARLWPRLLELYKGYAGYQRRTARDIPVVILTPGA